MSQLKELREKLTKADAEYNRCLGQIDTHKAKLKEMTGTDDLEKAHSFLCDLEDEINKARTLYEKRYNKFTEKYEKYLC